jgi:hypothetical protein
MEGVEVHLGEQLDKRVRPGGGTLIGPGSRASAAYQARASWGWLRLPRPWSSMWRWMKLPLLG